MLYICFYKYWNESQLCPFVASLDRDCIPATLARDRMVLAAQSCYVLKHNARDNRYAALLRLSDRDLVAHRMGQSLLLDSVVASFVTWEQGRVEIWPSLPPLGESAARMA